MDKDGNKAGMKARKKTMDNWPKRKTKRLPFIYCTIHFFELNIYM